MRVFYWTLALAGLALLLLSFVADAPEFMNVMGEAVEQWYTDQKTWAAVLGAVIGVLSALIAIQMITHRPHEPSATYASRVGTWGLVTLVLTGLAVIGMGWVTARSFTYLQIAPGDRVWELLPKREFAGALGAGILSAGFWFAVVARFPHWGGRYTLLSRSWLPTVTSAPK